MSRHRNFVGTKWTEDELSDEEDYNQGYTPSPSPSIGSEYLYNRGQTNKLNISDYIPEDAEESAPTDDADLIKPALEHVKSLLDGSKMPSDEEIIRILRSVNYDSSEAFEAIFAMSPNDRTDNEMFQFDMSPSKSRPKSDSPPPTPPPGLGFSSESIPRIAPSKSPSALGTDLPSRSEPTKATGLVKKLFGNETLSSLAHATTGESLRSSGSVSSDAKIVPFAFDTPSPDDVVLEQQGKAFQRGKVKEVTKSPAPSVPTSSGAPKFQAKSGLEEQQKRIAKNAATPAKSNLAMSGNFGKDDFEDDDEDDKPKSPNPLSASQTKKKREQIPQTPEARKKKILEDIRDSKAKEHINLVVIGHVDAGKSTIMGHLLYLSGKVSDRTMHRYERDSKQLGKSSFHFAWVLDEHGEERERGVTTDIAVTSFETEHRRVTLLDAPGHRDFVPNMITGAAQADAAVLVLNANEGEFESGFKDDGQTKEHVLLAKALGVGNLIVAVNKLDMVDWRKDRYDTIVEIVSPYLRKSGFAKEKTTFVPLSGFTGENLMKRTDKGSPLATWYNGPSLLEAIDGIEAPARAIDQPTRLVVSDVYRDAQQGLGNAVAGKIEAGYVAKGDRLLIMPLNEVCQVKTLRAHDATLDYAGAGMNVEVGILGVELSQIGAGSVLCDPLNPVPMVTRFKAQLITFALLPVPLLRGSHVTLHCQNTQLPATIAKLVAIIDGRTGEVKTKKPKALPASVSATVVIQLERPVCMELYATYKQLGRFTIRDSGKTLAAGIVTKLINFQ